MVNLGLIGNIYHMKSYIEKTYELPQINIAGKSITETGPKNEDYSLPIPESVSYTHLDVYKRQLLRIP